MKKIRRVVIELEERNLKLSLPGGQSPPDSPDAKPPAADDPLAEPPATPCPDCGAAGWAPVIARLLGGDREQSNLRAITDSLNLHLHTSPSGHLWICQSSLQNLKIRKSEDAF